MEKIARTSTVIACLVFLLLLFLESREETTTVKEEKRTCESQSLGYMGGCLNHNCRLMCMSEGFTDGRCHGLAARCFCTKPC